MSVVGISLFVRHLNGLSHILIKHPVVSTKGPKYHFHPVFWIISICIIIINIRLVSEI